RVKTARSGWASRSARSTCCCSAPCVRFASSSATALEIPMADNDDDVLDGAIPDPDAEPTAAERVHAKTFADLVDKTLAGRTPPAMSADDRALLEVATVIRAASGGLELAPSKQRSVIEDALRQAMGVSTRATSLSTT